jgi:predicted ATP-grasp superfamily ATP-dependent carboligase
VLDPQTLYELAPEQPSPGELVDPVLLYALSGFIDAGFGGKLASDHLLQSLPHRRLATFDVDQLYDYRARRPPMTFMEDHWEDYDGPDLALRLVQDGSDTSFLMLTGPEPDVQWERFVTAVRQLVERYHVRLAIGMNGIPMAVPHTRPAGVTAHSTRKDLIEGFRPWIGQVQVPGNVGGLIELRLGQAGHDAAGFAVHVPHYLAQAEYPDAAASLLECVIRLSGLKLPLDALRAAGAETRAAIAEQVAGQPEVAAVVGALEQQYDAFVSARDRNLPLADDTGQLPTADELGAELERFLAEENERRGRGESRPES